MKQCRLHLLLLLLVAATLAHGTADLFASAPPPIVAASLSSNGHFLVSIERELGSPGPMGGRQILRTKYSILAIDTFLSQKAPGTVPATFWTQAPFGWTVSIPAAESGGPFWPFVSNDGKALILLDISAAQPGSTVMKIFRKRELAADGAPVREILLDDLWTGAHLYPRGQGIMMIKEDTPSWLAGGFLTFSPDDHDLLYTTPWHNHLRISLADGAVTRLPR